MSQIDSILFFSPEYFEVQDELLWQVRQRAAHKPYDECLIDNCMAWINARALSHKMGYMVVSEPLLSSALH